MFHSCSICHPDNLGSGFRATEMRSEADRCRVEWAAEEDDEGR